MKNKLYSWLFLLLVTGGCKPVTVSTSLSVTANKSEPIIILQIHNKSNNDLFLLPYIGLVSSKTVECKSGHWIAGVSSSASKTPMHYFHRIQVGQAMQANLPIRQYCPKIVPGEHQFELEATVYRKADTLLALQEKYHKTPPDDEQSKQIKKEIDALSKEVAVIEIKESFRVRFLDVDQRID